ncbi:MAG: hypothetical protein KatS3mg028_0404 [Bacteroidia bacterium]|nr:MAG: hypothetical protein KatS3mg028_0404 [Bacteroidia bacterium]
MKTRWLLILLVVLKMSCYGQGEENEYRPIPYTQKDRDILIELKVKVERDGEEI